MTQILNLTASLIAALALLPFPLKAQTRNCADHAMVVERLADGYGESRQSVGISADGTLVEVFASIATGTWTITVTRPGGPTCLVASGEAFQLIYENTSNLDPEA